jgi:hypothetical protein
MQREEGGVEEVMRVRWGHKQLVGTRIVGGVTQEERIQPRTRAMIVVADWVDHRPILAYEEVNHALQQQPKAMSIDVDDSNRWIMRLMANEVMDNILTHINSRAI